MQTEHGRHTASTVRSRMLLNDHKSNRDRRLRQWHTSVVVDGMVIDRVTDYDHQNSGLLSFASVQTTASFSSLD